MWNRETYIWTEDRRNVYLDWRFRGIRGISACVRACVTLGPVGHRMYCVVTLCVVLCVVTLCGIVDYVFYVMVGRPGDIVYCIALRHCNIKFCVVLWYRDIVFLLFCDIVTLCIVLFCDIVTFWDGWWGWVTHCCCLRQLFAERFEGNKCKQKFSSVEYLKGNSHKFWDLWVVKEGLVGRQKSR